MGEGEFRTYSGIPVKSVYTFRDLDEKEFDYARDLGMPGEYPFTRGITPGMYRDKLWAISQYAGYGTPEETNKRYKYMLEQGQTGVSIALDLPTQCGYDSDHPFAEGEVGKTGVPISSLRDMEVTLDGIALDKITRLATTANAIAPIIGAMWVAIAEKQGIHPSKVGVNIQNDVLKEYVARGAYIFPPRPSVKFATDCIEFAKDWPLWSPISYCGYHMREAGATAVQEVAFTIANGIAYIEDCLNNKGLKVDEFAHSSRMFLGTYMDLFEEVAKLRAARKLWAKIMKERFGAKNPGSWKLIYTGFTQGTSLTAQEPLNNIVRVTLECLAGVLGGQQSLTTSSYDESLGLPTEAAVKIAIRTQQIMAYESGVTNTVDPLGGSYYVESLTKEIEDQAREYLDKIDKMGGAISAIEAGYFQREIVHSAKQQQDAIDSGKKVVVGVNKFVSNEKQPIEVLKVDPESEVKQKESLAAIKRQRDNTEVKRLLRTVKESAVKNKNLVPPILDAVKAYATVGEICDTLREVWGEYTEQGSLDK